MGSTSTRCGTVKARSIHAPKRGGGLYALVKRIRVEMQVEVERISVNVKMRTRLHCQTKKGDCQYCSKEHNPGGIKCFVQ